MKNYDDNDPVELGWYEWRTLNATGFRVYLKSDKSREMYGFKLEWEADAKSDGCQYKDSCVDRKCGANETCDSFSGECKCDNDFYRNGQQCQQQGTKSDFEFF